MDKKNFKVGQVWRTRGGKEVKIRVTEAIDQHGYPVSGNDNRWRDLNGAWLSSDEPDQHDLVELVQDMPTPTPQETADAIFADAELQHATVGIFTAPECSTERAEHYAEIILRGMTGQMMPATIREYIDLYDSAVDGTSGKLTEVAA